MNFKKLNDIVGWIVFGIALFVYALTAEPTGSLWDCGEFIASAYKLEVCHPPGAPLFLMIGRMFTVVAGMFSKNPETIAYSVNLLSGVCTAFLILFIFWFTTGLAKVALVGRRNDLTDNSQIMAVLASGAVAGLTAAFTTSVWFSAVEGEVYAMSAFFTGIVMWAMMRWYLAPETHTTDRWMIFAAYMIGLSIGVHLLSLLMLPTMALMYYHKKYEDNVTTKGTLVSLGIGVFLLFFVQNFIIPRIPGIGASFDFFFVNSLSLPFGVGMLFFVVLLVGGLVWSIRTAERNGKKYLYEALVALSMILVGFSTYALILIRAGVDTPINMNNPSDPYSLVSYLNREQYGERPLAYGPHFASERDEQNPYTNKGDVYRPVAGEYRKVDERYEPNYKPDDMTFFPRLGHMDEGRASQYRRWLNLESGNPTFADNLQFFFKYQIGWMYVRYFMWNFVGRQNAEQGFESWDPTRGNWISGINFIDNARLYNQAKMPQEWKNDPGRNTYYFLPLIFGLIGMFWHFKRSPKEALSVFVLFLMTGLAIIVFLNQPPAEPRERDYGFAGSFFTFAVWVGLACVAIFEMMRDKMSKSVAAVLSLLPLTAPAIMISQNWDDHSRAGHYGARDYARNFLMSVEKDALIFTYGDNDTYPLWYCQEVENIRRDVRVVNFSLLAVDWYINQLQRKVNDSPRIKMTMTPDKYRGGLRNFIYVNPERKEMSLADGVKFVAGDNPRRLQGGQDIESYLPAKNLYIPVPKDKEMLRQKGFVLPTDSDSTIVDTMRFTVDKNVLIKDDVALLDIISNNIWERPIYFAVTCRPEKTLGMSKYFQLEGLGLRIVPVQSAPDAMLRGSMTGLGRVAVDKMFEHLTKDFRWGNFDKHKTFIDKSYMPSVASLQMGFIRFAQTCLTKGDKEKARIALSTYFKAFPHFNFPVDEGNGISILRMFIDAGGGEEAKKIAEQLVTAAADKLKFFESLGGKNAMEKLMMNPKDMAANAELQGTDLYYFAEEYARYKSIAYQMDGLLKDFKDEAFSKKMNDILKPYKPASPSDTLK